jgi:ubiquinone/menaquinone biosynthesis C-methylase UbiE/acyl carrier protein
MIQQSAYKIASFATNVGAETRRLNAQVDLFWHVESELLVRYGLRSGMRVLDCGCGPGRLLELMNARVPNLECVGVELDPVLVTEARGRLAEAGLSNCSVVQGSAEQPGVPECSFDFITLRLVLEHVPDAHAAVVSLASRLKPGGRLVIISNDFDFHLRTFPHVEELEALYAAYRAARRKDGGDPCIGRRVPTILSRAGLDVVAAEIEVADSAVLGDEPFLRAEGAGIPAQLVSAGFLEPRVLDSLTRSWLAMLETRGHSIVRPLWFAVAERGAAWLGTSAPGRDSSMRPRADAVSGEAPPSSRHDISEDDFMALVLKALDVDKASMHDAPDALGLDSIAALTLQQSLKERTGVELAITAFFESQTLRELWQRLNKHESSAPKPALATADGWEEGEL